VRLLGGGAYLAVVVAVAAVAVSSDPGLG
jgi:hypothetical protein